MKKIKGNKKVFAMSAAALGMVMALTLQGASAYFTTYVSAGGSQIVHLGSHTEIHEDIIDMTKHVSITNILGGSDCFVRIKVFHGGQVKVSYQDKSESGKSWTYSEKDGYWYYNSILPAGASTDILDIKILDLPEDFDKDSFNVVVVQECTPVIYDENGSPSADWDTVYTDYQDAARGLGEGANAQ